MGTAGGSRTYLVDAGAPAAGPHASCGKVLLAALDHAELARRFGPDELPGVEAALARVRRTGVGVNRGETEAGIGAVAVAVPDDAEPRSPRWPCRCRCPCA